MTTLASRVAAASIALLLARRVAAPDVPELFAPGAISTGQYESHPCFAADGKTLWYLKSTPQFDFWTIVVSRLEGARWSPPVVADFSGRWSDADPCLSADGSKLWFVSNRPRADARRVDLDVWFVERTATGWSEPRNAGETINSTGDEWFPAFAPDGTLYFGSDRPGGLGGNDVWRARPTSTGWAPPENLGAAINTRFDEYEAAVSPDGSVLVVMSTRPDRPGNGDLYLARASEGGWSALVHLDEPVNSPGFEVGARFSADGRDLWFASTRSSVAGPNPAPIDYAELSRRLDGPRNGLGDLYRVATASLLR